MNRSRTAEERLDRLAGDGERGGGLPLPLLFAAILEELLDHGTATTAQLTEVVADRLEFKAQRVMEVWGSWDALCGAVLQQMTERQVVVSNGLAWSTGKAFTPGRNVVIIPKRPGKNSSTIGVTVYRREEREQRGLAEEKGMTVTEYAQRLRDRGLRQVGAKRVEEIRASIREFGDHRAAFPVLVDQHGNLLDGRHRRQIDPEWPSRAHRVDSDEDMLQVALVANQGAAWSQKDWDGLARLVGAVGGQQGKRERIRQALAEHPEASHRDIARMLDMADAAGYRAVDRECEREVRQVSHFDCPHGRAGQGARTDRQSRPLSPTRAKVRAHLLENPQQSDAQICEKTGISRNNHRVVESERQALESEGAISPTPIREGRDGKIQRMPQRRVAPQAPTPATPLTKIMERINRMVTRWLETPPDPASELEELEALRRDIDERIVALRARPL